jgi:hypothetical protein
MQENQHTEWKESWRDDYLRWVCGFANAEGGTLVIGRNDRGQAVGVANAARLLEDIPNKLTFQANPLHLVAALGDKAAAVLRGLTDGATLNATPEVTPEVRLLRVMAMASLPALPRRALQALLELNDGEHFRKTYLLPALAGGLIEMTIPDKPTSSLQQYRLTEVGHTHLQAQATKGQPV